MNNPNLFIFDHHKFINFSFWIRFISLQLNTTMKLTIMIMNNSNHCLGVFFIMWWKYDLILFLERTKFNSSYINWTQAITIIVNLLLNSIILNYETKPIKFIIFIFEINNSWLTWNFIFELLIIGMYFHKRHHSPNLIANR